MPKATSKSGGRTSKGSPEVEHTMTFEAGGKEIAISVDDLCHAGKSETTTQLADTKPRLTTQSIQISARDLMEAGGSGTSGTTYTDDPPMEVAESGISTIITRRRRYIDACQLNYSRRSAIPTVLASPVSILSPTRKHRPTLTATRKLRSRMKTSSEPWVSPYKVAIPIKYSLPKEDTNVYNLNILAEAIQVINKPEGDPTDKNDAKGDRTMDTELFHQPEESDEDTES